MHDCHVPWHSLEHVLVIDTESYVDTCTGSRRLLAFAFELLQTSRASSVRQDCYIVSPRGGYYPDARSTRVHGLKPEDVAALGRDVVEVFAVLIELLGKVDAIAAHDINADVAVLVTEAVSESRADVVEALCSVRHICTKTESTAVCSIPLPNLTGWKWPSLTEAVTTLTGDTPCTRTHHDCAEDTRMCSRVLLRLFRIHTE